MGLQAFKLHIARTIVNAENKLGAAQTDLLGLFESAEDLRQSASRAPVTDIFDQPPEDDL